MSFKKKESENVQKFHIQEKISNFKSLLTYVSRTDAVNQQKRDSPGIKAHNTANLTIGIIGCVGRS